MIFWFIQFIPFASAALILLFFQRQHRLSSTLSVGAAVINAALAIAAFTMKLSPPDHSLVWLEVGLFQVEFGFIFDNLAALMLLIVTCVGGIIHVYSLGYMRDDEHRARYFGYLSLFMGSMIGIVLANNFIQMFIFWELVGLSSYLLIGFWYGKESAAQASKKAFLCNKIGDFGFMLGIICVWTLAGSFNFLDLAAHETWLPVEFDSVTITITIAAVLIFCGTVGKSAQFPLHVWLPDAMEGPTPVSALIHAATMVAAGVYMLARVHFLISASSFAMAVIAASGAITMCMAAFIATQQNDIKRILAYSTLSQLGYMVTIMGIIQIQGETPAMFHLTCHACFKALLFLSAGSVIVALHHEQNIWKMGGLAGKMPITFIGMLIGGCALMGVPTFSGGFSKDLILLGLYDTNKLLFYVGLFSAFLTAFYMTRLLVVTFFGLPRGESAMHAGESPAIMTLPLIILSFPAMAAGYQWFGIRELLPPLDIPEHPGVEMAAAATVFAGIAISTLLYWNRVRDPLHIILLQKKLYFDEVYEFFVRNIQGTFAALLAFFDRWVLDFCIYRGGASIVRGFGWAFRHMETGNIQTYALFFGAGAIALIGWLLL